MAGIEGAGRSSLPAVAKSNAFRRRARRELGVGYMFTLPSVLLLFLFTLGPALYSLYLSFFSWSLLNHMHFVGWKNFEQLFQMPLFWISVRNSVVFALVVVPTQTVIALGLAAILNQNLPARGFFRLAFFFPAVSSSAVISIIFMWIYNKFGLLNGFLSVFGIVGPDWLGNPQFALSSIMVLNIWTTSGYFMIVFLAGLQAIPAELYEASAIDGASRWKSFTHITVPLLSPSTFFIVVMGIVGTLQMFDQSFIMSQGTGGPLNSTTTIVLLIYQFIFSYGQVGYGAAATVLLFILILLATLATNWWFKRKLDYL